VHKVTEVRCGISVIAEFSFYQTANLTFFEFCHNGKQYLFHKDIAICGYMRITWIVEMILVYKPKGFNAVSVNKVYVCSSE